MGFERLRCLKSFSRSCWLEENTCSRILSDENEDQERQQNMQMQEITIIVARGTCHCKISSTLDLYSSALSALGAITHCLATNLSISPCRIPDLTLGCVTRVFPGRGGQNCAQGTEELFPAA